MKKGVKISLIIAMSLILLGSILFLVVMTANGWDFNKLSTGKMQTNRYTVSESFDSISVDVETTDVQFIKTDEATGKVVCFEKENAYHEVTVQDGVLQIRLVDQRKWYEFIGFHFKSPTLTVYVPTTQQPALNVKGSTGDVNVMQGLTFASMDISVSTGDVEINASTVGVMKVKTSTGDIDVKNLSAGSLDISVSTGDIELENCTVIAGLTMKVSTGDIELDNVTAKTLTSTGDTGEVSMQNVVIEGKMNIARSTGDVEFVRCDAGEIFITTDTGDVQGSLLSDKNFVVYTDTGRVRVPSSNTGGRCEITTDTGDVEITIVKNS